MFNLLLRAKLNVNAREGQLCLIGVTSNQKKKSLIFCRPRNSAICWDNHLQSKLLSFQNSDSFTFNWVDKRSRGGSKNA